MTRLLLVDDQAAVRQGWRMRLTLEPDLTVLGEVENGQEAIQKAIELRPDVILMDLDMPLLDGAAATKEIKARLPECTVIIVSIHDNEVARRLTNESGATMFVGKQEPFEVLLSAIRQAARGEGSER
jgi:DNA-binding NarL/FixJ family response regulator